MLYGGPPDPEGYIRRREALDLGLLLTPNIRLGRGEALGEGTRPAVLGFAFPLAYL